MTDELTPEQEAAVRRLLAQARHDGPMPEDVAHRLDAVLDGLSADDVESAADAAGVDDPAAADPVSPTDLAGVRRRRRNAGRLLLAAAAVLIGGVVVGQNVDGAGSDNDAADAGSGGSTLAEAPRDAADPVPGEVDEEAGGEQAPQATSGSDTAADAASLLDNVRAPLRLTSDSFALDVQRQLGRPVAARRQAANADFDGLLAYAAKNGDFVCPDGAYGQGATLPAYYDAEEAVLVLRRPRAGTQRVELLTCGTAVELNSVELSAP
ncbi:hypothetical protein [Nocardioides sp.]|uniref:hypothetical protein n=1 Tax=Nocardioides sp. TaxID=35761 RepID=UPI001A2A779F|nr:hypothetical protein [Nocardioides sp.]MBJ7357578.1 hypothetical protein [Nocardioides sp.]